MPALVDMTLQILHYRKTARDGIVDMRLVCGSFLLFWLVLTGGVQAAGFLPEGPQALHPLPHLAEEHYHYTLDFLLFKDLAEAQLQVTAEPTPGRYRAELVAHTLGVASWLSGDRTQRYVSIMEVQGGGLRSISHESSIHKRKHGKWTDRQKRYRFDYQHGKVYQERGEDGHFKPGLVFELPADRTPVDILTGFYNLRRGIYGALTPGARLTIPTFTSRGIAEIVVEVLTGPQRLARSFFPATGILLRVMVDPEVFDTKGADLYVWFDDTGRPARGIVENVIGMGDVYGHLREEQKPQ
jgi:hypothetical protein